MLHGWMRQARSCWSLDIGPPSLVSLSSNLDWTAALLLGAVLAPTDAAAVFSVLRKPPLPHRLAGMLEAESGLNDAPAVLAVTLFSQLDQHLPAPALIVGLVAYQLVAGALTGLLVGVAGAFALRRVALPASG